VRGAEEENAIRCLVQSGNRSVVAFVSLHCSHKALRGQCLYPSLQQVPATYMSQYDPSKAVRNKEKRPLSKLAVTLISNANYVAEDLLASCVFRTLLIPSKNSRP
jgi:hypothetical protein